MRLKPIFQAVLSLRILPRATVPPTPIADQGSGVAADLSDDRPSMFSRTGITDIFGKLDDETPTVRISGDVLDRMRRNARAAGIPFSEYFRNKLYVGEYGYEHVKSMREAQFERAMGIAPINALHKSGDQDSK